MGTGPDLDSGMTPMGRFLDFESVGATLHPVFCAVSQHRQTEAPQQQQHRPDASNHPAP